LDRPQVLDVLLDLLVGITDREVAVVGGEGGENAERDTRHDAVWYEGLLWIGR